VGAQSSSYAKKRPDLHWRNAFPQSCPLPRNLEYWPVSSFGRMENYRLCFATWPLEGPCRRPAEPSPLPSFLPVPAPSPSFFPYLFPHPFLYLWASQHISPSP